MLLNRHGANILRVKGLMHIAGREAPVVVQGVQHLIHKPAHLDRWPDGDDRTRLVLIVDGLDPALIERSFAAFMRLGAETRAAQPALSSA
jgi:G3E family GTPase